MTFPCHFWSRRTANVLGIRYISYSLYDIEIKELKILQNRVVRDDP